jgi:hypothetical protein
VLRHNSWQFGFNTRWNYDIKIVKSKEHKLIEAPLWRIRPFKEVAGHVLPNPSPFDRSPIAIGSFLFDDSDDNGFTISDSQINKMQHLGFIVTATHIINCWTVFNPEN